MGFKEILNDDLNVFFNPDEFGEEIGIDGIVTIGILEDKNNEGNTVSGFPSYGPDYLETIWEEKKTIYIKEGDCSPLPKAEQELNVNGYNFKVITSKNQDGMAIITIGRNGS